MSTYKLGVVPNPDETSDAAHRPDRHRLQEREAKFEQVAVDIAERHEKGQPVLVGTTSVEKSEYLSKLLAKKGVKHEVLNAEEPRPRSRDRRAGRSTRGRHGRHEHGRPLGYRHHARRQTPSSCRAGDGTPRACPRRRRGGVRGRLGRRLRPRQAEIKEEADQGPRRRRVCTSSVLERHESRRIDNQIRGRSGRQGDRARAASTVADDD